MKINKTIFFDMNPKIQKRMEGFFNTKLLGLENRNCKLQTIGAIKARILKIPFDRIKNRLNRWF